MAGVTDITNLNAIIDAVVAGIQRAGTGAAGQPVAEATPAAPAMAPAVSEPASPPTASLPAAAPVAPVSTAAAPPAPVAAPASRSSSSPGTTAGDDDLPDPTTDAARAVPGVRNPRSQDGLEALMSTTCARIGVGRAGPRWRTSSLLLFQADHAVAKDAIYRQVDQRLLDEMGLFTVRTRVTDKEQYLLRPDLGRLLSDEGKQLLQERCQKSPTVQVVVGDGLSAAAIEANLKQITPVLEHGFQRAGIQTGTPFFVQYARVGLMNDINTIVGAEVIVYLIGERPGLGRATSMSVYLGYRPAPGLTDADRDVVCNIFDGGTNPLEAGAYVVQLVQQMLKHKASGVKLKLVTLDASAAATGEAR